MSLVGTEPNGDDQLVFGHDRDELTAPASGNPRGMAVWIDVKPPHQTALRGSTRPPSSSALPNPRQDLFAVRNASAEVELTELEHVRRAKPQQATGGVQARSVGAP